MEPATAPDPEEIKRYLMTGQAEPIGVEGTPQLTGAGEVTADDIKRYLMSGGGAAAPSGGEHGTWEGMAHQALKGATLNASDYFSSPDTIAKNKKFQKEHPWLATAGQGVGFVAPMLTPAGWAARGAAALRYVPGATRVFETLLPFGNFTRAAAPGAGWRTMFNQSGLGAIKANTAMRFNEALDNPSKDPDLRARWANNFADRGFKAVGINENDDWLQNLKNMGYTAGMDYAGGGAGGLAGGAVGKYFGNAIDTMGRYAAIGRDPGVGARLALMRDLRNSAPGGNVPALVDNMRNAMYGTRNWRQQAFRNDPELPREIARLYQDSLNALQPGQNANHARDAVVAELQRRGIPGSVRTHQNWVRQVAQDYQSNNPIHANFAELAGIGAGGEAPALNKTLQKLLNLQGEGHHQGELLRAIRERQSQIGPQVGDFVEQRLGSGDVRARMAELAEARSNANDLYTPVIQDFNNTQNAPVALRETLRAWLQSRRAALPNEDTPFVRALRAELDKFEDPTVTNMMTTVPSRPTSIVRENVKRDGQVVGRTEREVPVTRLDSEGNALPPGDELVTATQRGREPTGDLQSWIRRRSLLGDEIGKAKRAGDMTLARELTLMKNSMDDAVRGIADDQAIAQPIRDVFGNWGAANDSRAYAGSLNNAYTSGLGLNLKAQSGEGLMNLNNALRAYRGMDPGEQEMFRAGIMGQIKARLDTKGDLHDTAKLFSNPRTRNILNELIGEQQTAEIFATVQRAGMASHTYKMDKGSQTSSILDSDKHQGWLEAIWGLLYHGSPSHALRKTGEAIGDTVKRQKYDEMTRLLSQGTHNPRELDRTLDLIRRAGAPRPVLEGVGRGLSNYGVAGGYAATRRDRN